MRLVVMAAFALFVLMLVDDQLPEPMPAQVALLHPNKRLIEQKKALAFEKDEAPSRIRSAGIRSAAE